MGWEDGLARGGWDVRGLGGDWVEGVGEEAQCDGFGSGEDVYDVQGAEGVEGLEAGVEEDSDAEGFLASGGEVVCR